MNISAEALAPLLKFSTLAALVVLGQGGMLSGCSTHSAAMQQQVEQQTSDQNVIQAITEALETTENRFAKAQANDVDVYSPGQLAHAKSALSEARRYLERFQVDPGLANRSNSLFFGDTLGNAALTLIARADEALTLAEENKQQADAIFAAPLENFEWLKKFNAPTYYRDEYQDLQRAHQQLVENVSSGDMDAAQRRLPHFLAEQRALEIVAAQRFYLFDLDRRIAHAGGSRLERHAPISYGNAAAALNKAKSVIARDSRDEQKIKAAKADTEFSLEVANAVAADMQRLASMDRHEMERWLILLTTRLSEMGQAVGAEDVRNKELLQQLELLAQAVAGKEQSAQSPEQAATTEPAAKTDDTADAGETAATSDGQAIDNRVTQLEQSLAEQIKAISEQINAMREVSVSAKAAPAEKVTVSEN